MTDLSMSARVSAQVPARVPPQAPTRTQQAETTARDFEAMFLTQSFEQSFKTLPATAFGGGEAGETWRHFLARAIADQVADQGSTGIAQGLAPTIEGAMQ